MSNKNGNGEYRHRRGSRIWGNKGRSSAKCLWSPPIPSQVQSPGGGARGAPPEAPASGPKKAPKSCIFTDVKQGRIQNLHCRGGGTSDWKASLRRVAPKGGVRGRGYPFPQVGVRGSPPENFEKYASKWCILSVF